jgi:hypothetical protein
MKNKIFRTNNNMPENSRTCRFVSIANRHCLLLLLLCPVVALAQTPDLRVCDDKGYKLTSTADAVGISPVTYEWYENGQSLGEDYASNEISFDAAEKGAGTYVYVRKATNAECNTEVSSNTFTVVVLAAPVPTINVSTAAVCQNGTAVEFSIAPAANTTYTWEGTAGTPGGDDRSTYTVGTGTPGNIQVRAKASVFYAALDALGAKTCESDLSTTASATVNPLPVVIPTGTFAQCGGGAFPLSVTVTAGGSDVTTVSTITWYSDAGGTTPVETGASYTTPSQTTSISYYVGAVVTTTSCASASLTKVDATVNLYEGEISGEEI